jgi:hypothetical protein
MADEFSKIGGVFPLERANPADGGETIAMTLEEFGQAHLAIEQALKFGNYAPLLERQRGSGVLLGLERNMVADIAAGGGFKKPKHRMAQEPGALRLKRLYLALSVSVMMGKGDCRKAAVDKVAEENHVSTSTVRAAVRENPDIFAGYPSK